MRLLSALLLLLLFAVRAAGAGPAPAGSLHDAATAAEADGLNRLTLIEGGHDALLLRLHLIREARETIELQTFIWANDECGRLLMFELLEAARRGVRVRLLADHMFSEQDPALGAFLATADPRLQVKHYRPAGQRLKPGWWRTVLAGLRSFRDVNQRMHNKVMLVDGRFLLTGGRNIENTYFDQSTELNFRDRDVLAVGPVAQAAAASFARYWDYHHAVPSQELVDVAAVLARGGYRRYDRRDDWDFGSYLGPLERELADVALLRRRFGEQLQPVAAVTFVADDPGKSPRWFGRAAHSTRELRAALERAEHDILIQTPYLVLSPAARRLLRELRDARPQLRVRISTNSLSSTDNLYAYSANYRLRNVYVEQLGMHIYEFKPEPAVLLAHLPNHAELARRAAPRLARGQQERTPFLCLHAKSLVIDQQLAFIGSYNLDPRSENLNTEAGLLIEDEGFARQLRQAIERDIEPDNSWVIGHRPLPLRLDVVNGLIDGLLSLTPIDVWPVQDTSSFARRPHGTTLPPDHPDFHQHYEDVGSFPGREGPLNQKEILTRLYKAVGSPLTPIL